MRLITHHPTTGIVVLYHRDSGQGPPLRLRGLSQGAAESVRRCPWQVHEVRGSLSISPHGHGRSDIAPP